MNVREWALPVYTILMQLAVGALFILWIIRWRAGSKFHPVEMDRVIRNPLSVILFTVIVAMGGSHFHLSRPFHSFYAVRNFAHSWLSREIVFTVIFFLMLFLLWLLSRYKKEHRLLLSVMGWVTVFFGFSVVYCMARIYMLPTQIAWNSPSVIVSFYLTMILLGAMAIALLLILDLKFAEIQKAEVVDLRVQIIRFSMVGLTGTTFLTVIASSGLMAYQVYNLGQGDVIARTSMLLLFQLYTPLFILRLLSFFAAPGLLGYVIYRIYKAKSTPQELIVPVYMSCLLMLVSEIVGRFLFYAIHIRIGV